MMYCDKCAKKEGYPRMADKRYQSYGPCELCGKTDGCNDIKASMLDIGDVEIFHTSKAKFLKMTNKAFKAEKGQFRIVACNLNSVFGDEKVLFVPAFFVKDYKNIETARKELENLREGFKKEKTPEDYIAFLYDDKGKMQKASA